MRVYDRAHKMFFKVHCLFQLRRVEISIPSHSFFPLRAVRLMSVYATAGLGEKNSSFTMIFTCLVTINARVEHIKKLMTQDLHFPLCLTRLTSSRLLLFLTVALMLFN